MSINVRALTGDKLRAVTPDDNTDLEFPTTAIWVGVGGNLAVIGESDQSSVVLVGVPAGSWLSGRYRRIMATGTTAGSLVIIGTTNIP